MEIVSVIMPCYNDGKYIMEAIQSVIDQTYKNIEIIVIDDGSEDYRTKKVLSGLDKSNIKLLYTDRKGPAAARNKGIEYATGAYILPLDADDKIERTYVEKSVEIIENGQNIGIVYCKGRRFGRKNCEMNTPEFTVQGMLIYNLIFVTALFRIEDWKKVNGYCEEFKYGFEDYDFWMSILEYNKNVYRIDETLFFYRSKKRSRNEIFQRDIEYVKDTYALLYKRHAKLYEEYNVEYIMGLRNSLIETSTMYNVLKEKV